MEKMGMGHDEVIKNKVQAPYMPLTREFMDGAHDYLGNSANTDSIRQAK